MSAVADWVERYRRAWDSNDPEDIRALFTEDAVYLTEPYAEPWRGHDEIVAGWLDHKDEPGDWKFKWEPLAESGDVSMLTGTTDYGDRVYSNLWVIRLDADGRAREFTEWYMQQPASGATT
jgi:ketosteroid isomerase-like protein